MNEFSLIDTYFKSIATSRDDVVFGIGDDAACLLVPSDQELLISTDTLVADVHFSSDWDAFDIAYKAVMVNVSDIIAMAGIPCWLTLALTLPELDDAWLERFSLGLKEALNAFNIALIGGDTTRGPLSLTITIHGLVPRGKAVRRIGACIDDGIYVTGTLGLAAMALETKDPMLQTALKRPKPSLLWVSLLQQYASSAIDVSDGLLADLNHICERSQLGACLQLADVPCQPGALTYALYGGDDYELCFTVPKHKEADFLQALTQISQKVYCIGRMISDLGLKGVDASGETVALEPRGYQHF